MKNLNPNDPEFTAKALGEETEGTVSKENREAFEELQGFAKKLESSLQTEEATEKLDPKCIQEIKAQPKRKLLRFPVWTGSIAALLLLSFTLPHYLSEQKQGITENEFIENNVHSNGGSARPSTNASIHKEKRQLQEEKVLVPEVSLKLPPKMLLDDSISSKETILSDALMDFDSNLTQEQSTPAPNHSIKGKKTLSAFSKSDKTYLPGSATRESRMVTTGRTMSRIATESLPLAQYVSMSNAEGVPFSQNNNGLTLGNVDEFKPLTSNETYAHTEENSFKAPANDPLSTFSIDVDTASYSNVRRMINDGILPVPDAVRTEEFINYFSYDYSEPTDEKPFAVHLDVTTAPWEPQHKLVRIALKGKSIEESNRPNANLVFLIDVSGSMNNPNKLPLVKKALNHIVRKMNSEDRIAIVVYAGSSGLVLPSTTANNQETISHALENLSAGGSTNGGEGIELAYKTAKKHFISDGINRVILCTDGDFNVGTTDQGSLIELIQKKAETGIFFSAVGFGKGNYHDSRMELLSNTGNGNYAYIDSEKEARKVFSKDMLGTLYTIAKDVKIQVEFNPNTVAAYRLIGYENRLLAKEDFNNDKKDAGEIGSGHTVTALYEIIPVGLDTQVGEVDELRYQKTQGTDSRTHNDELLTAKLRYKMPNETKSHLIVEHLKNKTIEFDEADDDLRFASGLAAFAMRLKESEYLKEFSFEAIEEIICNSLAKDEAGLRYELLELVEKSRILARQ